MNAKYASKPNLNPNEANLFGFARFPLHFWILNFGFAFWVLTFEFAMTTSVPSVKSVVPKNEPNFKTEKTLISRQKRRNGGQKPTPKNETNPIVDNFACTLNAVR